MNEQALPEQILDRYRGATLSELNEQELATVQKHLAEVGMEAIFGALPLQSNTGFVSKEVRTAQERISGTVPGPYIIGEQYEPTGLMLYIKRITPQS
jgi:hypothetical protein